MKLPCVLWGRVNSGFFQERPWRVVGGSRVTHGLNAHRPTMGFWVQTRWILHGSLLVSKRGGFGPCGGASGVGEGAGGVDAAPGSIFP